jgi:hypothetical protein
VPSILRFLVTFEYPDLFVGHHSLRSFMGQEDQLRVASSFERVAGYIRDSTFGHGHLTDTCADTCLLSFYGSYGTTKMIIIIIGQATRRRLILKCLPKP